MPKEYLEAAGGGNIGLPATCDQAVHEYGARNAGKSLSKRAKAATLNSKSDMITKELLLIFFQIHMLMAWSGYMPFNSLNIITSIII